MGAAVCDQRNKRLTERNKRARPMAISLAQPQPVLPSVGAQRRHSFCGCPGVVALICNHVGPGEAKRPYLLRKVRFSLSHVSSCD